MLDGLIQQFAGQGANNLEGEALHGGVAQMLGSAPNEHGVGAIGEALGASELGTLASYAAETHPNELASVMGSQFGGSGAIQWCARWE